MKIQDNDGEDEDDSGEAEDIHYTDFFDPLPCHFAYHRHAHHYGQILQDGKGAEDHPFAEGRSE